MKWLYKLDYKYGKYYIHNLMTIIVAGMVVVFLADMFTSAGGFYVSSWLTLSRYDILRGQVWRLITFIFVPSSHNAISFLLFSYFYWQFGRMLESAWGGFRFNIYYLIGILGAIASMFITGGASNYYLNLSVLLALATIAPDMEFRLFFILPLKAKWLVIGYAILMGIGLLQSFIFVSVLAGIQSLITLAFSLLNYAIFFGPTLVSTIKEQKRIRENRRNWRNNWRS